MDDLVVGDIVILASGGPAMTVADVMPWGELFCVWFTPDRRCIGEVFDRRLVRRLTEPMNDAPTAPVLTSAEPALANGTPPLGNEAVHDPSIAAPTLDDSRTKAARSAAMATGPPRFDTQRDEPDTPPPAGRDVPVRP